MLFVSDVTTYDRTQELIALYMQSADWLVQQTLFISAIISNHKYHISGLIITYGSTINNLSESKSHSFSVFLLQKDLAASRTFEGWQDSIKLFLNHIFLIFLCIWMLKAFGQESFWTLHFDLASLRAIWVLRPHLLS